MRKAERCIHAVPFAKSFEKKLLFTKCPQISTGVSGLLFPPFHLHRLQCDILISFGQFHHSVCVPFLKTESISINGISSDLLDEIRKQS